MADVDPWEAAPVAIQRDPWDDGAPKEVGTGEDVLRSAPTGLYHGVTGLATLPGNMDDTARYLGHWIAEKIAGKSLPLPGRVGEGILPTQPELESLIGIKPYEAQTPVGKFTEGVASFVPGAVAMPAKSAMEVGGNLLKYAVTPEVTGKTARGAAQVVGASPQTQDVVESIGQIAGAGVSALKDRPAKMPITTAEEVHAGVNQFFKAARAKGVVYKPDVYRDFINDVGVDAARMHINPDNFPGSAAIIKRLDAMNGAVPDLEDLYQLRQQAGGVVSQASRSGNANDLRGGMMLKKKIDEFLARDNPSDVMAGDPTGLGDLLKQGKALRVQQDKIEIIDDAYRSAELSRVGQTDMDTALSNEFRKIAKSRDFGKFTTEEQSLIEDVVKKSKTEKVGAFLEQFANPRSPRTALVGSGVGAAAAMGIGIPWQVGAAVPPAFGMAGRAVAQGITERQAAKVAEKVAGGAFRPSWQAGARLPFAAAVPLGNMATTTPPGR